MPRLRNTTATPALLAGLAFALAGCTRHEHVPLPPPTVNIEVTVDGSSELFGGVVFSGTVTVPAESAFDNIRADITGTDQQIIATVEAPVETAAGTLTNTTSGTRTATSTGNGKVTLTLPAEIPAEQLCKAARDNYNDYEGFWPAEETTDRTAKVAELGDIIACNGNIPVGRLYLTDRPEDTPEGRKGAAYIYFHYADRTFTLSGYNLTRPPKPPLETSVRKSFRYEASFAAGWNAYIYIENGTSPTLCTTDLPDGRIFRWHFEPRP